MFLLLAVLCTDLGKGRRPGWEGWGQTCAGQGWLPLEGSVGSAWIWGLQGVVGEALVAAP